MAFEEGAKGTPRDLEALVRQVLADDESRKKQAERLEQIEEDVQFLKSILCDEKTGKCHLPTRSDIMNLIGERKSLSDDEILGEFEKRVQLHDGGLSAILAHLGKGDNVSVAVRALRLCKSEEDCEKIKSIMCEKYPGQCALFEEKLEEKKEKEHWATKK